MDLNIQKISLDEFISFAEKVDNWEKRNEHDYIAKYMDYEIRIEREQHIYENCSPREFFNFQDMHFPLESKSKSNPTVYYTYNLTLKYRSNLFFSKEYRVDEKNLDEIIAIRSLENEIDEKVKKNNANALEMIKNLYIEKRSNQ